MIIGENEMCTLGMYLWKIIWNIFSETFVTEKNVGLDYTAALLFFSMFNFWKKYEENVNVLIHVLFIFHICGIYKEPTYLCSHPIAVLPSSLFFFLVKNLWLCSLSNKHKEKETFNFPQEVR